MGFAPHLSGWIARALDRIQRAVWHYRNNCPFQLWRAAQFTEWFFICIYSSPHPWEVEIRVLLYGWGHFQGWGVQPCLRPQRWAGASRAPFRPPASPSFGCNLCPLNTAGLQAPHQIYEASGSLNCTKVAWIGPSPQSLLAPLLSEFGFIQGNEKCWGSVGVSWLTRHSPEALSKTGLQEARRVCHELGATRAGFIV